MPLLDGDCAQVCRLTGERRPPFAVTVVGTRVEPGDLEPRCGAFHRVNHPVKRVNLSDALVNIPSRSPRMPVALLGRSRLFRLLVRACHVKKAHAASGTTRCAAQPLRLITHFWGLLVSARSTRRGNRWSCCATGARPEEDALSDLRAEQRLWSS